MREHPPPYCAWLLRCWAAPGQTASGGAGWRFTLEDPHTGERRGFADFAALVAFLRAELAGRAEEPGPRAGARVPPEGGKPAGAAPPR